MRSISLSRIIERYPRELKTVRRLARLADSDRRRQFTLEQIYKESGASSVDTLALILSALVRDGLATRVFRVQSPFNGRGLGDFGKLEDVPREMQDEIAERAFTPTPDDVKTIFILGGDRGDKNSRSPAGSAKPARRNVLATLLRSWHGRTAGAC